MIFRNVPPRYEREYLFSFLLAAVFATALIFVSIIWAAAAAYNTVRATDQNLALLKTFAEVKKGTDVSVIMLGNSRLRHAANFGYNPEETVRLPDGRTMAVLQFSENASEYRAYEFMESEILSLRPDVLVVMDAVLSNRRYPYPLATAYGRMVYDMIGNSLSGHTGERTWKERQDLMPSCHATYNVNVVNTRIRRTAERDAHSLDMAVNEKNLAGVRKLIDRALKAGTKVVILSLPPNREILERYAVPQHLLDFAGLGHWPARQELLPDWHEKVTWVEYSPPEWTPHYCDFVHLNSKGRALSHAWLLRMLQDSAR